MSYDCYCDADPCTVYRAELRKAAKLHRCDECGAPIATGDKYENVFGVTGDGTFTARTCANCLDVREWVKAHVPCLCWFHNSLHNDLREAVEAFEHETDGLKFGFLRRIVKIKRAGGRYNQYV